MIVDTSALVAVVRAEDGWRPIAEALRSDLGFIITPVLVEFRRVTSDRFNRAVAVADDLLAEIRNCRIHIIPMRETVVLAAIAANEQFGTGNGLGGKLNMLDLMVYGAAKEAGLPILCTGKDFIATDALIHDASRRD